MIYALYEYINPVVTILGTNECFYRDIPKIPDPRGTEMSLPILTA
jgi:hypothetical protein